MATPKAQEPCLGGDEIYNFGRPFFGHHYYILNLTEPCPSEDQKRRNIAFSLTCHAQSKKNMSRAS